ncbi:MAG TPA: hypothetical protein VFR37_03200 [Longimicrobium sp.]|nr:hypothetical protein [Longimicrobium sp.]
MKAAGRRWRVTAMGALAVLLAACSGDGGTGTPRPTTVVAASPTSQTALAGEAVSEAPSVRVTDQQGQAMAGVAVTFAVTGGGGTLASTAAATNAQGVATAGTWILGAVAGQNSVTATVAGLSPVQFTATAQARTPGSIAAVTATTQTGTPGAAVAQAPAVRVNDQTGQPLAGVTVAFAVTGGGGTVGVTSATTDAGGIATSGSWILGLAAGQNTVTATVAGLTPVEFTATAQARAPGSIAAVAATSQTGIAGAAVAQAPAVRVNDQTGQPLAGVSVDFAVTAGGGTVGVTSATTDAGGIATSGSWTLGPAAGQNAVTATVAGLAPVQFTATAQARVPGSITPVTATTQTGTAGAAVAQAPAVRVNDQLGEPLAGASVDFAVTAGGGTVGTASATTDAGGVATSGSWVLGPVAGQNTVTATVAGLAPVVFTATSSPAQDPCTVAAPYTPLTTVGAALTSADCRVSGGYYVDFYETTFASARAVTFRMSSSQVNAWLEVYGADGDILAFNDDAATGTSAEVNLFAPAGGYFLAATTRDPGELGSYQLSSSALGGAAGCNEYWVVPGINLSGGVASTDCVTSGYYSDLYFLVLQPGQQITVRLESTAFDAVLELYDAISGELVAENDDGAGGTNAQLVYTATETSIFGINATTWAPGSTGAYTLIVSSPQADRAATLRRGRLPAGVLEAARAAARGRSGGRDAFPSVRGSRMHAPLPPPAPRVKRARTR